MCSAFERPRQGSSTSYYTESRGLTSLKPLSVFSHFTSNVSAIFCTLWAANIRYLVASITRQRMREGGQTGALPQQNLLPGSHEKSLLQARSKPDQQSRGRASQAQRTLTCGLYWYAIPSAVGNLSGVVDDCERIVSVIDFARLEINLLVVVKSTWC